MTRAKLILILWLSLLLPLQAVAAVLLSADYCPEQASDTSAAAATEAIPATMTVPVTVPMTQAGMADADEAMPCCPDQQQNTGDSGCKTLKSCHLCKTPGHLQLTGPATLASLARLTPVSKPAGAAFASQNPASIWRPPSGF